jgi:hypothetical protein
MKQKIKKHYTLNNYFRFLSLEDKIHAELVEFINKNYPDIIYTHIPAEGKKSSYECYKHSIMGTKKGICDFIFLKPKYKFKLIGEKKQKVLVYCGLAIELKVPSHNRVVLKGKDAGKIVKSVGKLSTEQKEVIEQLNKEKYLAVCCFGFDEAKKVIIDYLKED